MLQIIARVRELLKENAELSLANWRLKQRLGKMNASAARHACYEHAGAGFSGDSTMTIEQPRELRLNLSSTNAKQSLCQQPDGLWCYFAAIDSYAFFHGHAEAEADGTLKFSNMYTVDRLGTKDVHCGCEFTVGGADGSASMAVRDELRGRPFDA